MKTKNINNLISLWETAGRAMDSFHEKPEFNYSAVENSEWPNRIWFKDNVTPETLKEIKELITTTPLNLTLPNWNDIANNTALFSYLGFRIKFQQVGMSIKLEEKYDYEKRLVIILVDSPEEAQTWEDIYPHAFGYKISKDILSATKNKIQYYLAYLNDEPVGTAILFKTGNIAGIHGVGVVPTARRKGFAEEIMKHVLNESIEAGMGYSTLQASDMGKGIYLRLGYTEDFLITNYVLEG